MSGLNPRACRMNVSRSGPCFRPQSACISDKCSLLSKGLRGGMSRSDRVVSLSRHMLQSARSWRPKDEKRNTSGLGSRPSSSLFVVGRALLCRLLAPACWLLSLHPHVCFFLSSDLSPSQGPCFGRKCNVCRNRIRDKSSYISV